MLDVLWDTLLDCLKTAPFLFGAFLLMEFIEHRSSGGLKRALAHSGWYGSALGAALGSVPQCGFSVAAVNLYAGKLITLGTLISVFLSTSDEAVPLLMTNAQHWPVILKLIAIKVVVAVFFGFLIDLCLRNRRKNELAHTNYHKQELCEHCHCERGIFSSALRHTGSILAFLIVFTLALNIILEYLGQEAIAAVLITDSPFQPALAALIGFIPNCASSILLVELYTQGSLSFASVVAGLCTGTGVGLAVLFRMHKKWKHNVAIAGLLFLIAVLVGFVITLLGWQ